MSETYYHGSRGPLVVRPGICLTTSERCAGTYGDVHAAEIDLGGLVVRDVAGYDRNRNEAVADRADELAALAAAGVDVIAYEDEDEMGRGHDCIRLLSARALARLEWSA